MPTAPKTPRVLSTNMLANSPHYETILNEYNKQYQIEGKVNNLKFYREVIVPLMPEYKMSNWYKFLRRFQTTAGLQQIKKEPETTIVPSTPGEMVMLDNHLATAKLVQSILNVSADRAAEIAKNPSLLSAKEAIELGLKVMKAQDSRIHAVGKLREDNRQQEKFDRAFSDAATG